MYSAVSRTLTRGLLCSIQTVETRTADPWGAGLSAARLAPRALSTGVVVSLEKSFVLHNDI